MVDTVDKRTNLPTTSIMRNDSTEGGALCLNKSKIPVGLNPARETNQSKRYHPILHRGRIWVEGEDLEFNRVEPVNRDGCLGVRVQILVELLQYSMNSGSTSRGGEKVGLFLSITPSALFVC